MRDTALLAAGFVLGALLGLPAARLAWRLVTWSPRRVDHRPAAVSPAWVREKSYPRAGGDR